MDNLESIAEEARQALAARDEAREKMLPLCRESIRYSSITIRAVHRRDFDQARENLERAGKLIAEAKNAVREFPELAFAGAPRDAEKELAEANVTMAIVEGRPLPTPSGLGVDTAAYLNGVGEAAGEVRRYLLDSMRRGDLSRGEELLTVMDDIYSMMTTLDFPDAITAGLRRTTDMVRGVLERTRSDLTLAVQQKAFEERLARAKSKDFS